MVSTFPSDRIYIKNESVVFRKIAEECLLVPVRKTSKDVDGFYRLNETATRVWELIDGSKSVANITDAIMEEFGVTRAICFNDVLELIQLLEQIEAVTFAGTKESD